MDSAGYISFRKINYEEYMSEISKFSNRNYDLGPVASQMLMQFVQHPYLSAYNIFSSLRKMGGKHKMAYKNVHKRIKQLQSLNLIREIGRESISTRTLHNPKYYRLTTGGIFHLMHNATLLYHNGLPGIKQMFQNYSENIIFRTILYPYFGKETLSKVNRPRIFRDILDYMNKCCTVTEENIQFRKYNDEFILARLFNWDSPEEYKLETMVLLNEEFNLRFTEQPQIEKIDGGRTIKISSKNKSVFIKLADKKDTAILTTADKKTYELGVELSDGKYYVGIRIDTYKEAALKRLVHDIQSNLFTLALSIIVGSADKEFIGFTEETPSSKILSQDKKLMSLLERTKKIVEERYQKLIQLKV
jgi:hypothetical protein